MMFDDRKVKIISIQISKQGRVHKIDCSSLMPETLNILKIFAVILLEILTFIYVNVKLYFPDSYFKP